MSEVKYFLLGTLANLFILFAMYDAYLYQTTASSVSQCKSNKLTSDKESKPPFTRVVFITVDGLRGDIFFRYPETHPFLTNKTKGRGCFWGTTHVAGPIYTVQAHVAMFAGIVMDHTRFYPFQMWHSPPREDTLFTHIESSIAITRHPPLTGIFYEDNPKKTFGMFLTDKSVLETFIRLIKSDAIPRTGQALIFLHFADIDIFGHDFAASSRRMKDEIQIMDNSVANISRVVNDYFRDNKTLFALTADHGMSETFHHGFGTIEDATTPFIAWGDGLESGHLQADIRQVDWAPFVAAMLGVHIPSNSIGRFVHATTPDKKFAYESLERNYLQLKTLATTLRSTLEARAFFVSSSYSENVFLDAARKAYLGKDYPLAISMLDQAVEQVLTEIRYYWTYDRRSVQLIATLAVVLWLPVFALFVLSDVDTGVGSLSDIVPACVLALLLTKCYGWPLCRFLYPLAFLMILPPLYRGFQLTPSLQLRLVALNLGGILTWGAYVGSGIQLQKSFPSMVPIGLFLLLLQQLGLGDRKPLKQDVIPFLVFSGLICLLAYLPPVGFAHPQTPNPPNSVCRALGVLATFILAFSRTTSHQPPSTSHQDRVLITFYKVFIVLIGISHFFPKQPVTIGLAWGSLLLAYIAPMLVTNSPEWTRWVVVFLATSAPYLLMSITYEAIFYPVLFALLSTWSRMDNMRSHQDFALIRRLDHSWIHLIAVILIFYGQTRPYHIRFFQRLLTKPYYGMSDTTIVLSGKFFGPLILVLIFRMDFIYGKSDIPGKVNPLGTLFLGQFILLPTFLLGRATGHSPSIVDSIVNILFMAVVPWGLTCIDYFLCWTSKLKHSRATAISILIYTILLLLIVCYVLDP